MLACAFNAARFGSAVVRRVSKLLASVALGHSPSWVGLLCRGVESAYCLDVHHPDAILGKLYFHQVNRGFGPEVFQAQDRLGAVALGFKVSFDLLAGDLGGNVPVHNKARF